MDEQECTGCTEWENSVQPDVHTAIPAWRALPPTDLIPQPRARRTRRPCHSTKYPAASCAESNPFMVKGYPKVLARSKIPMDPVTAKSDKRANCRVRRSHQWLPREYFCCRANWITAASPGSREFRSSWERETGWVCLCSQSACSNSWTAKPSAPPARISRQTSHGTRTRWYRSGNLSNAPTAAINARMGVVLMTSSRASGAWKPAQCFHQTVRTG